MRPDEGGTGQDQKLNQIRCITPIALARHRTRGQASHFGAGLAESKEVYDWRQGDDSGEVETKHSRDARNEPHSTPAIFSRDKSLVLRCV